MKLIVGEDGIARLRCAHGVEHPSKILTQATGRRWSKAAEGHGCCRHACCTTDYFAMCEAQFAGAARRKGRA